MEKLALLILKCRIRTAIKTEDELSVKIKKIFDRMSYICFSVYTNCECAYTISKLHTHRK